MPIKQTADRVAIYEYCKANGLVWSTEVHDQLKALLLEYVQHETERLVEQKKAWDAHVPKCELFLARQEQRRRRKQSLSDKIKAMSNENK